MEWCAAPSRWSATAPGEKRPKSTLFSQKNGHNSWTPGRGGTRDPSTDAWRWGAGVWSGAPPRPGGPRQPREKNDQKVPFFRKKTGITPERLVVEGRETPLRMRGGEAQVYGVVRRPVPVVHGSPGQKTTQAQFINFHRTTLGPSSCYFLYSTQRTIKMCGESCLHCGKSLICSQFFHFFHLNGSKHGNGYLYFLWWLCTSLLCGGSCKIVGCQSGVRGPPWVLVGVPGGPQPRNQMDPYVYVTLRVYTWNQMDLLAMYTLRVKWNVILQHQLGSQREADPFVKEHQSWLTRRYSHSYPACNCAPVQIFYKHFYS